jgi:hypothetical protein
MAMQGRAVLSKWSLASSHKTQTDKSRPSCVGGVKGGHRIKVREALDLVTFLTGLLNSRLRVIIMENPKDTLNSYTKSVHGFNEYYYAY